MNVNPQVNETNNSNQDQVDTNSVHKEPATNSSQETTQQGNAHDGNTGEDPNWKAFREARKKDRAEREAAERRAAEKEAEATALKAAMEAAFAKSNPVAQPNYYSQPEHEETEDERIEKKVNIILEQRVRAADEQRAQIERQEYPRRLAKDFPDFNQTIAQEHLDYLDFHYPEVSRPLQRLQDGYDKWHDIYRAVKKFVPNQGTAKKEASRAEANLNKPKSISSMGITQPGEPTTSARLTEEKRAANWARMQATLKGVG